MLLRNATLQDLPEIMKIERQSFIPQIQEEEEVFRQRIMLCPETFLIFDFLKDEAAGADCTRKTILPAPALPGTAGYICGEFLSHLPASADEIALGHAPCAQNKNFPYFYISSFALLPEFRGNGNGKLLWNKSLEYFSKLANPGCKFLLLVNSDWQNAFHIYQNSGFKTINTFKNFFPRQDGTTSDGILMLR